MKIESLLYGSSIFTKYSIDILSVVVHTLVPATEKTGGSISFRLTVNA